MISAISHINYSAEGEADSWTQDNVPSAIINHIIGLSGIIYICNMEEIIPVGLASTRHAGRDIFPEGMCPGNI
jgi:hypothetical protein